MIRYLLILLPVFIVFASCSKHRMASMTVVKDCTGVYLRQDKKDYHVCNDEILSALKDGSEVKASFVKVQGCPAQKDRMVCMMYHENEGWIEVERTK
jgi:DhnA family fructose-bisphosphate aldolase class Ia